MLGHRYVAPVCLPLVNERHFDDASFSAVVDAVHDTPDGCDMPEWVSAMSELRGTLLLAQRVWSSRDGHDRSEPRPGELCPFEVQNFQSQMIAGYLVYGRG